MKKIAKILIFALIILIYPTIEAKAENASIEDALNPIIESLGKYKDQVCISYYNTLTGETYYYNEDKAMIMGSVYKLPLCMIFEEMVNAGEISWDENIGGYKLSVIFEHVLENSNNELAESLKNYLGGDREFHKIEAKYYGLDEGEEVEEKYLSDNRMNSEYVLNVLKHLYENKDDYSVTLSHILKAQEGEYAKKFIEGTEIAQKYGFYEGYLNCAAIVYLDEPFLMSVLTYNTYSDNLSYFFQAAHDYSKESNAAFLAAKEEEKEKEEEAQESISPSPVPTEKVEIPKETYAPEVNEEELKEVFNNAQETEKTATINPWLTAVFILVIINLGLIVFRKTKVKEKQEK